MNTAASQAIWPLATLALLVGTGLAALLAQPRWKRWRHERLRARPFPRAWALILQQRVPLAARLPQALRTRLHGLIQVFIADKPFIGCQGQAIDDELRVTIAAQACLLLLGQNGTECYPQLRQVLVYPEAFIVRRRQVLPGGVVAELPQALAGESWAQGQVILAWSEVLAGATDPSDGRNVVLHEFAHQIDQDSGAADGRPWQHDATTRQRWATAMDAGLAHLREAGEADNGTMTPIDAYGATDPAEFFAVATEVFFEQPQRLADAAGEVYRELARLYRLDPRAW